jgi:hypothetical protein
MVAKDAENDVKDFEGSPFNGKTVAQYFSCHGVAINALAKIIIEMLKEEQK